MNVPTFIVTGAGQDGVAGLREPARDEFFNA